jgi:hypothetical protein
MNDLPEGLREFRAIWDRLFPDSRGREVAFYDPVKGLKTIAVAEATETLFVRAKNAEGLFRAIETKLRAQAEYVVWRDSMVTPSQEIGKQKKRDGISVPKSHLPEADPGTLIAHKWRKKFCTKGRSTRRLWCKCWRSAQESAREPDADHAPSTAFQISGAVLFLTRSLPSLN